MKVLVLGLGKGSFAVRGEQLGRALGARVRMSPVACDIGWADVVVLVKHAGTLWADIVHRYRKPLVWDALDFWQQPADNGLDEGGARALLQQHITRIQPDLVIGATRAMASACGGAYLPHHSRPKLTLAPMQDAVNVVAYEGTRKYLGRWAKAIKAECEKRGWRFVINPRDLRIADILVAFRDGVWDGWMCQQWKSGVKLVNAMAAGRPILTQPSAAWDDLQPVGATVDTVEQLEAGFDRCVIHRAEAYTRAHALSLATVAEDYRAMLGRVA